ncbi:unnamed protein product [Effrenium voratum]|nr:unnamed protein product [Effrenium voratum]
MERELTELLRVEDFVPEEELPEAAPVRSRIWAKATAASVLCLGLVAVLGTSQRASPLEGLQEKYADPPMGQCLCLFDVDRTLTSRQLQDPAATADEQCPATKDAPLVNGKVVIDYAYKAGRLRLSDLAQKLDQSFCSRQKCFMGVISAGGASGDDEKQVLYDRLHASSPGKVGGQTFGEYAQINDKVWTLKMVFTPDPNKGEAAKKIFDWLNSPDGHNANIPSSEVYFFDDHLGNAGEMAKYGFNGREVSCRVRDQSIGNGLVGLCGAELSEVVPSKGITTCAR